MSTSAYSVKVNLGQDIRRFVLPTLSFDALTDLVRSTYQLPKDMPLTLKYLDDEKDWIVFSSDEELKLASQFGNPIRVEVSRAKAATPMRLAIPRCAFAVVPPSASTASPSSASPPSEAPAAVGNTETNNTKQDTKEWKKQWRVHFKQMHVKGFGVRLVSESIEPEQAAYTPGQPFVKKWKLRNESPIVWHKDMVLAFKRGNNLAAVERVALGKDVQPQEEIEISVPMTAPTSDGTYICVWRMLGPMGRRFIGEPLKFKITVKNTEAEETTKPEEKVNTTPVAGPEPTSAPTPAPTDPLQAQLAQLREMGFANEGLNRRILRQTNGDLDRAVFKLVKISQRKHPHCG